MSALLPQMRELPVLAELLALEQVRLRRVLAAERRLLLAWIISPFAISDH